MVWLCRPCHKRITRWDQGSPVPAVLGAGLLSLPVWLLAGPSVAAVVLTVGLVGLGALTPVAFVTFLGLLYGTVRTVVVAVGLGILVVLVVRWRAG